jgi:8-hydroxy-5-deazaflavin:NADPH oxidoreductase
MNRPKEKDMRIGIIGAGHIGGTLAALFVRAGHDVGISNSRGPDSLRGSVEALGDKTCAMTVDEAAAFGDLAVVAIPFGRFREVPIEPIVGKIVIDANNYYPQRDGSFDELDQGRITSSEMLQVHLTGARVVKAFNAIRFDHLASEGRAQGDKNRLGIPIAGDDELAKRAVSGLIDQVGFDAVDVGRLAEGRRFQPGTAVYIADLTSDRLRERLAA